MTNEERLALLDETLYFFARYAKAMARGAMHESHLEKLSLMSDEALDNRLLAIEWAIRQNDLDYRAMVPSLPNDRPTIVSWLEIALRDTRALRASRKTP